MRILITGGFGFIGSRLGQYFHERGYEVILGSRKKRPPPNWLPGAQSTIMKWDNSKYLLNLCSSVDIILHCAGMNAADCDADPVSALVFNGLATARLARAADTSGVQFFVYFSTAHVYSEDLSGEISEDWHPSNKHPYARSHLYAERAALDTNQGSKMNVIVLRLSNVIGAPADKSADCWRLVANDLCRQSIEKGRLELRTSGIQTRDFIGITELSRAVDYLLNNSLKGKSEIFNVGGNYSLSIRQLAYLIQERFEKNFNKSLQLFIPSSDEKELIKKFEYKIDKLLSTKFVLKNTLENDIDELLIFCKNAFVRLN